MDRTVIILRREFQMAPVDKRIYQAILDHVGRSIYEGVYDPDSSLADEHGFRKDVLKCLKPLSSSLVRYPGGNFASGYHWLDEVIPKNQRLVIQDMASNSIELYQFGADALANTLFALNRH